jgi:hypothetical protein
MQKFKTIILFSLALTIVLNMGLAFSEISNLLGSLLGGLSAIIFLEIHIDSIKKINIILLMSLPSLIFNTFCSNPKVDYFIKIVIEPYEKYLLNNDWFSANVSTVMVGLTLLSLIGCFLLKHFIATSKNQVLLSKISDSDIIREIKFPDSKDKLKFSILTLTLYFSYFIASFIHGSKINTNLSFVSIPIFLYYLEYVLFTYNKLSLFKSIHKNKNTGFSIRERTITRTENPTIPRDIQLHYHDKLEYNEIEEWISNNYTKNKSCRRYVFNNLFKVHEYFNYSIISWIQLTPHKNLPPNFKLELLKTNKVQDCSYIQNMPNIDVSFFFREYKDKDIIRIFQSPFSWKKYLSCINNYEGKEPFPIYKDMNKLLVYLKTIHRFGTSSFKQPIIDITGNCRLGDISFIRNAIELKDASRYFNNCAFDFLEDCIQGHNFFYTIERVGKPILMFSTFSHPIKLAEIKRKLNDEPSSKEVKLIKKHIETCKRTHKRNKV